MVQFYIFSLIIDFVSCLDIWNQELANPIHHHQDSHLKRSFAGQSRSSPPRPSPQTLPTAGADEDPERTPPPAERGSPPAASPAVAAAAAGAKGNNRGRGGGAKGNKAM